MLEIITNIFEYEKNIQIKTRIPIFNVKIFIKIVGFKFINHRIQINLMNFPVFEKQNRFFSQKKYTTKIIGLFPKNCLFPYLFQKNLFLLQED